MLDAEITLAQASKLLPKRNGKHPHVRTLKRWVTKGCRGRRLEAVKIGGIWYTTREALLNFQHVPQANNSLGSSHSQRTTRMGRQRTRELLKRYGIDVGRTENN